MVFYEPCDFFSSLSGGPWIGLHDPDENNTFVWLNGSPLPNDDETWSDGQIVYPFSYIIKIKLMFLEIGDRYKEATVVGPGPIRAM